MIVYKFTRDTSNKYYIQTAVVLLNSKRAARVIGVSIQFDYFYNKSVSLQFKEKLYQFSTTFNLSLPKVYAVASSFSGGEIQKHNNRVYTKLSFILPPYALTNRQRNSCFIGRFHYYYYYVEFYSRARLLRYQLSLLRQQYYSTSLSLLFACVFHFPKNRRSIVHKSTNCVKDEGNNSYNCIIHRQYIMRQGLLTSFIISKKHLCNNVFIGNITIIVPIFSLY